jgi:hypothetical protein
MTESTLQHSGCKSVHLPLLKPPVSLPGCEGRWRSYCELLSSPIQLATCLIGGILRKQPEWVGRPIVLNAMWTGRRQGKLSNMSVAEIHSSLKFMDVAVTAEYPPAQQHSYKEKLSYLACFNACLFKTGARVICGQPSQPRSSQNFCTVCTDKSLLDIQMTSMTAIHASTEQRPVCRQYMWFIMHVAKTWHVPKQGSLIYVFSCSILTLNTRSYSQ